MLTVIVGENGVGKTRYLDYLYKTLNNSVIRYGTYDNKYKSCELDKKFMEEVEAEEVNGKIILNGLDNGETANPLVDFMCRDADVYLIDEIDSNIRHSDSGFIYDILLERAKDKDVVLVTHDFRAVSAADNYTLRWVDDIPILIKLSRKEAQNLIEPYA